MVRKYAPFVPMKTMNEQIEKVLNAKFNVSKNLSSVNFEVEMRGSRIEDRGSRIEVLAARRRVA